MLHDKGFSSGRCIQEGDGFLCHGTSLWLARSRLCPRSGSVAAQLYHRL